MHIHRLAPLIGLLLLLTAVASAYFPGLTGGFHLDDVNNLAALGAFGGVHDLLSLSYYLTSGFADPTGRPISLLSFLVDARDWPAPAHTFKVTNLCIHLANGALLFLLISRLEARLSGKGHAQWTALLAAGLWLAHPMWVSTTMYVVQRHAMLPVLFGLLALIAWDASWSAAKHGNVSRSWLLGIFGVSGFIALAALSKPNGILIAAVGLLIANMAYPRPGTAAAEVTVRRVSWLALAAPTILCFAWLAMQFSHGLEYQGSRPWTLAQRLLTEPRVLSGYLHQLLWPSPSDPARFSDAVIASTGLNRPWSTAMAIAGLLAAATVAVLSRRRMPRTAIAISSFLVAHAMESGPVMLELAFEHRNYLPSLFLFWPFAHALCTMRASLLLRGSLASAVIVLLSVMTFVGAQRWGDSGWFSPNLNDYAKSSPRSAGLLVERTLTTEGAEIGRRTAQQMSQLHPGDLSLAMLRVEVECLTGEVSADGAANTDRLLRDRVASDLGLLQGWLGAMAEFEKSRRCPGLDPGVFRGWIEAVLSNRHTHIEPKHAQIALRIFGSWQLRGNDQSGIDSIKRAVAMAPRPEMVLHSAAALAEAGQYASAIEMLDSNPPKSSPRPPWTRGMARVHEELLHRTGYWETEFRSLRQRIEDEAIAHRRHE